MIKNTTYNLIDTLRFLGGEEQWREWYNFYNKTINDNHGINNFKNHDYYNIFAAKFNLKPSVASIIVDTLEDQWYLNSLNPNTPFGVPSKEIVLTPQNYLQYLNKTVQFNKKILDGEHDPNPGMRAKIIAIRIKDQSRPNEHFEILFDLTEFETHNDQFMIAEYFDKERNPTLTWKESIFYPKDKKYKDYLSNPMPFEIV